MRFIICGLCLLSAFGCSTTKHKEVDKKKSELHLRMGTTYLTNGNYPAGLRELLEANKYDDSNPIIHNNLSMAYLVREKYQLAESHARKAINLKPDYTEARNNLGRILIETRQYDLAVSQLERATDDLTYSNPEQSFSNLGLAYLKKGEHQKALESLRKSLKIRRDSCQTMSYYGLALFELNKFADAAASFDQAIRRCEVEKSPQEEPYYYSGLAYWKMGDRDRSLAKLHEVVQQFPESEFAGKARNIINLINRAER